jgi:hypothetical protein
MTAVIDLGKKMKISQITAGFLHETKSWIFRPENVDCYISEDGIHYAKLEVSGKKISLKTRLPAKEIVTAKCSQQARFVKVVAENIKICPEWHAGKGGKAWIFVDEIIVE